MPISALSAAFQFAPGFALQDGGLLTQLVNDLYAAKSGIVAFAGFAQAAVLDVPRREAALRQKRN